MIATSKMARPSPAHPPYKSMVLTAIQHVKDKKGISRQALLKYIVQHNNVDKNPKIVNARVKMALAGMLKTGDLKHQKGSGLTGRFKVDEAKKKSLMKGKIPRIGRTSKSPKRRPVKKDQKKKTLKKKHLKKSQVKKIGREIKITKKM